MTNPNPNVNLGRVTATVRAGTVIPLPSDHRPIVTNVGTQSDAVFNFGIPVGEKGEPGIGLPDIAGTEGQSLQIHEGVPIWEDTVNDVIVNDQSLVTNQIANVTPLQDQIDFNVKAIASNTQAILTESNRAQKVEATLLPKSNQSNSLYAVDQQGNQTMKSIDEVGRIDDVTVDGVTIVVNKIAKLNSDDFGKVDDVVSDGESLVINKIADISQKLNRPPMDNQLYALRNGTITPLRMPPAEYPSFSNPSSSFSRNIAVVQEIDVTVNITFTASFNRGAINPQFDTVEPFRAGLPNTYNYQGIGLPTSVASTALSNQQILTGWTVQPGVTSWRSNVSFDQGPQPTDSYGNIFSTPLPAGTTGWQTVTVEGVFPWFGTNQSITVFSRLPLVSMGGSNIQVSMVAESDTNKQAIQVHSAWTTINGVQFLNPLSNQWEWLGGSRQASLNLFTITNVTVNGLPYLQYTNNGPFSGARQLRFFWS